VQKLQDRVAVVTGAASGIGLAMSNRFTQAGMKVVLADIETEPLDAAVNELRVAGHDAIGVVADVAAADAVNDRPAAAFDTHGAVHVLCNNAGVVKAGTGLGISARLELGVPSADRRRPVISPTTARRTSTEP
jgi:NADP-dependent 3-hydroxy acid dehydrogenase YdfG